ncbi:hybrid sensor histidine kinase/response regulator [Microbacter margulisiae]|uniref:histidine kinase n=1 Tax=Microbacter margulisiae TaxID=1350067 RepID=A0A7W5H221_9PORP|nr:response regulator [Microbacter margulisiae]MBB3188223.1 signal transduction histidine kinase/CheY-like chemotaxis protein/HAMP domain-containing protein [Microbacter margulisiae]
MKLKNIKISTQLQLTFGVIWVFILVLGLIAWRDTDKIAQQTVDMYNHPLSVSRSLSALREDVSTYQLEAKNNVFYASKKEQEAERIAFNIHITDAEQQFTILYSRYLGPRIDIDNAHKSFVVWKDLEDDVWKQKQIETGQINESLSRLGTHSDLVQAREQLTLSLNKMDAFAQNKADQFLTNASDLKRALNVQLAVFVICILLISIVIFLILSKSILTPLREMRDATSRFREGDLSARSTYVSSNALGRLAESFNELADTIETELTLNERAAQLAGVMLSEEDAHQFSHALLKSLIQHTEAIIGAVFLLNNEKTMYEPFESIGMNKETYHSFSALNYEGEFGMVLATRKLHHIKGIPKDSKMTFSTVSGDFIPREIITIPIIVKNEIAAILSLSSITRFSDGSLRLLDTVLVTLNARMEGILTYRKVVDFAKQLEIQNNELESQKRELAAQTSELTEQNVELAMQKKQLGEANKMKNSFLSSMSHELRTPLNSVIALSNVLSRRLSGKLSDEEYSYIGVIERNGKQLLSLINDILDLSRIEAGREEIRAHLFNMNDLIRDVVETIEPQSKQKKLKLIYIPNEALPEITSDYDKCRHILQNIVANAIKFTEKGKVEIRADRIVDAVQIDIIDTGIGIKAEFLPHIFEEFRQADGSNSRKYGGTGLGLAIAKKYANMLGGQISVESAEGHGSHFTFSIPVKLGAQVKTVDYQGISAPVYKPEEIQHESQKIDVTKKTILVVEDTEAIVIQLCDILETEGYHVMVAHNGQEALERISEQMPDTMILDLMMPEVDGFEVLRHIREEKISEHLPVIILTAKYVTKDELAFLTHNSIFQLIRKGDINKAQLLNAVIQSMLPADQEISNTTATPQQLRIPINERPTVLIVEDNADNMLTIKALLEDSCVVIEAEDGISGVELAKQHVPHIILMDIALPGMSGIEALHILRKNQKTKNIPVIAVSASAMKGDRESFLIEGFDDYVSKPIDSRRLDEVMHKWLQI